MFVALLRETADTLSQARAITDINNSNIAELDTLLDDLNSAQRAGFNREYQSESSLMLVFRFVRSGGATRVLIHFSFLFQSPPPQIGRDSKYAKLRTLRMSGSKRHAESQPLPSTVSRGPSSTSAARRSAHRSARTASSAMAPSTRTASRRAPAPPGTRPPRASTGVSMQPRRAVRRRALRWSHAPITLSVSRRAHLQHHQGAVQQQLTDHVAVHGAAGDPAQPVGQPPRR